MIGMRSVMKVIIMCFKHMIISMDAVLDMVAEASAAPEVVMLALWKPKSSRGLNSKELGPLEDAAVGMVAVLAVEPMEVVIDYWGC